MLKGFWRKLQFPIALACGAVPICAVRFALLAPELLYLAWVLPAAMVLFSIPCLLLPNRRLTLGLILSLTYIAAGIWLVFPVCADSHLITVPILYGLLLLYTVSMGSWPWYQELPSAVFILGALLHVAAQLGISYLNYREFYALEPIRTGLLVCFLLFMLMLLLSRNRTSLAMAAREQPVIPQSTRRKNLLLVLAFFLIIAALSCLGILADGIMALLRWILTLLTPQPAKETTPTEITAPPTEESGLPNVVIPHTSEMAESLQTLLLAAFRYILPVVLFACVVTVVILLCKYSSVFLRKLRQLMERYTASAAADYEDEISDVRDSADPESIGADAPVRLSFLQRRKLSAGEKIRYRYRQLKKRNSHWSAGSTARENLPGDASPLYEEARYSENPISKEDAAAFTAKTKHL